MSYTNYFTGKKNKVATFYPKGTMTKDADTIYKVSKNKRYAPGGEGSAIRWLTYYLNRGGRNIKPKQRKEIEKARRMLQKDLAKKKRGSPKRRSTRRSPKKRSKRRSRQRSSMSPRRSRRRSKRRSKSRSKRRSKRRSKSRSKRRSKSSKKYRWLSYSSAAKHIPEAKKKGVSKVARGRSGFMGVYKRAGSSKNMDKKNYSATQTWGQRRSAFIKRHMAQYRKNPTRRRWLALAMWAYKPPGRAPK